MILHPAPQHTEEWLHARLGIPTASQFHRILTPKTLNPSAQADKYLDELLAEWQLGRPIEDATSGFMERGKDLEDKAVDWYEMMRDCDVQRVGLCLRDDGLVGYSPDGLVGDDGLLEIKTPSAVVHMGYLRRPESLAEEHRLQVQGGLWVTGRKWCDIESFNPELLPALFRCERDEAAIAVLEAALMDFSGRLEAAKVELRARGIAEFKEVASES